MDIFNLLQSDSVLQAAVSRAQRENISKFIPKHRLGGVGPSVSLVLLVYSILSLTAVRAPRPHQQNLSFALKKLFLRKYLIPVFCLNIMLSLGFNISYNLSNSVFVFPHETFFISSQLQSLCSSRQNNNETTYGIYILL